GRTGCCRIRAWWCSTAPVTHRRRSGRTSSTGPCWTSLAEPVREPYRGPDYLAALSGGPPMEALLHPDPLHPPRLYRLLVWLLKHVLPLLFRVELRGLENLPPPPFILASNHQRWLD